MKQEEPQQPALPLEGVKFALEFLDDWKEIVAVARTCRFFWRQRDGLAVGGDGLVVCAIVKRDPWVMQTESMH